MNKIKYLSAIIALQMLFFFIETNSYADAIQVPEETGGSSLVTSGIIVAFIALIAGLIIYLIRKKKNAGNK